MQDFKYRLSDLIDIESVSKTLNLLYSIAKIPNALIDMDGNILARAGWQTICTDFHRKNPDSEALCIESDKHINAEIAAGKPYCIYECPLGLVDSSYSVIVDGHHLGNVFSGQILQTPLTEKIRDRFRAQAEQFSYDKEAYMEALEKVPVFPIKKHKEILKLLSNITEQLASSALIKLNAIKLAHELEESEALQRAAFNSLDLAMHVVDADLYILMCNKKLTDWANILGYDSGLVGKYLPAVFPFLSAEVIDQYHAVLESGISLTTEESNNSNGQLISTKTTKTPLKSGDKVTGVITVINDITEYQQMIDKLLESEEKYKALYENAPLSYQSLDEDGCFLDINPTWLSTLGYTREEVIGKQYADFLHPDWKPHFEANFPAFKKRGYVHDVQFKIRHKQGNYLDISFEGCVGYTSDGLFKQTYCVFQDITERKQVEKKLQRSEIRYRNIYEGNQLPVLLIDPENGHIEDANPAALAFYGWDLETLVSKNISEINTLPKAVVLEEIEKAKRENRNHFLFQHRLSSGEVRDVKVNSNPIKISDKTFLYSTIHDITQQKQAELELINAKEMAEENEARFKALHNASFGGIAIHDKGLILECNQGLAEISGYPVEDLIGMDGLLLIAPESREMVMANIVAGYEKPYEATGLRKDGTAYPLRLEARMIPYKGQQVRVVEFRDETKQKSLESQLRQSQKLEAVGTMVGGISHELNNILQSLFLYGGLVRDDLPEDEELLVNFDHMLKDGERARDIVKQILTFSRKTKMDMKPQLLHELVLESLVLERASLPANIEIRQNIDLNGGSVLCDKTQIHQIIINLCNNAQHAMEEKGGTLTVSLQQNQAFLNKGDSEIEVLELKVSDTGHGIDAADLEKVFDPFFTTKQFGQGTGLGLSVIHGIVEMMEGQITVTSAAGIGTTFRILFPVVEKVETSKTSSKPAKQLDDFKKTILLVDDEDSIRLATQTVLTRKGFTVTGASDGKLALALFKANPDEFDLIVTDQSMPKMSGSELTRELRNSKSDVPIILSTGRLGAEDQKEFKDIGITSFIQKPWTADELITKIQEIAEK